MMMQLKQRIIRAICSTILIFLAGIAGRYVGSIIRGQAFDPKLLYTFLEALFIGVITSGVSFSAEQRKKNREKLYNKFFKKK